MNFLTNVSLFKENSRFSLKKNVKQNPQFLFSWTSTFPIFRQCKKMKTFFSKPIWRNGGYLGLNSLLKFISTLQESPTDVMRKKAKLYEKGHSFQAASGNKLILQHILLISSWVANISVITVTILGKMSVSNYEFNFTSWILFMTAIFLLEQKPPFCSQGEW